MTAAGFAKYALLRMHDDGLICARSGRPSVAELATIGGDGEFRIGAPRSMKMGTIRSPCLYDTAARHALQSEQVCDTP
jgi:hypothetical protein